MKNCLLFLLIMSATYCLSCKDDGDVVSYDYHAHIMHPSSANKNMGDILPIQVEFESHAGEAVEHINIRIFNKTNLTEVYSEPSDPHLNGGDPVFMFEDQVQLTAANGFSAGDWIIEATVWGHDDGQDQVTEKVEFHVNP